MLKQFIPLLKFILFFGVGALILYLVYVQQNAAYQADCALKGIPNSDCSLLKKVFSDFAGANFFWLFIVMAAFMITNLFRALRWNQMIRTFGYKPKLYNSFGSVMLAYVTNLGIPRSGEIIRPVTMSRYEKIPFDKLVGTIVLERAIDVLMLLIIIILTVFLAGSDIMDYMLSNQTIGSKFQFITNPLFWLLIIAVMAAAILLVRRSPTDTFIGKLWERVKIFLGGLKLGATSVKNVRNQKLFWAYSISIWVIYFLMTYICFFSFEPTAGLNMKVALVVFVLGTLGIIFPSPGGMGSYHYLVNQGLILYGVSEADGFSFANILFFSIQIFCNVFFGLLSYIFLPILNKRE